MNNPYGKVALITGASSGIGKCTAEELMNHGFRVYGVSRSGGQDRRSKDGFVRMLCMDVCDGASIRRAVGEVIAKEGRIDILINGAGIGICGAVEDCSAEDAVKQMDTNYFGIVRMLNAVLPHMRERRNGLIINIGSVGGIFSIPFQTLYSSSKFAVEALTEGLRMELKPWGIKAALIEPGDTKTGFTGARRYAEGTGNSAYEGAFKNSIAQMEKDEQNGMPPSSVTKAILSLIKSKNPPVRRTVGIKYKLFVGLKRFLPARIVELLLTSIYAKGDKPGGKQN